MAKVILTGMTALQCTPPAERRVAITKLDVPRMIANELIAQGHTVDWRWITLGEDLPAKYDAAIVCAAPITSLNSRKGALGTLWALQSELPTAVFFDDWQFGATINTMRQFYKTFEKRLYKVMGGAPFYCDPKRYPVDEVRRYESALRAAAELFNDRPWPERWHPLVPTFAWGDRSVVAQKMKLPSVDFVDPTPGVLPQVTLPDRPYVKERRWLLASLMPHEDWVEKQGFSWPVDLIGGKNRGQERLKTESDVVQRVAEHWGVLSPKYDHAGSGWFRARFLYAAWVGSVVFGDARETAPLFGYHAPVSVVESADSGELVQLAARQRELLLGAAWDSVAWSAGVRAVLEKLLSA